MTKIIYLKGDATEPQCLGNKIIPHICNDMGGWGQGFTKALTNKWSLPEQKYRDWYNHKCTHSFAGGKIQFAMVKNIEPLKLSHELGKTIWVANMIAQNGYKSKANPVPLQYDWLELCLIRLKELTLWIKEDYECSIHMPKIGAGLAGGDWNKIERMTKEILIDNNIEVYVYEL